MSRARPVPLLAALCAAQLAITAWFAFETPHNGFVWYSGGASTEYWTGQWAVAHLRLTQSVIGWGLPVFYAWVPLVTGDTLLSGLPVIVVFQALVLVPLTVILIWLVADRLYGRVYAWGATVLWIAGPLLLLRGMPHRYRWPFEQNFLAPHVYGLTNMADLPSVVLTLACAWATLRALDSGRTEEWLLAGLIAGGAIGVEPANGFFLVAVAALLALCRQLRGAVMFAIGIAPAVLVLVIWKQRGLGGLPSVTVPWDPHHLHVELRALMEVFWSVRLLEWIAIAGVIAALRRAPVRGTFLVVWFVMFCVVKGSSTHANITTTSTSYFRLVEPGLPAYALLAASIVYLVPRRRPHVEPRAPLPVPRWALAFTGVVGALLPLALVLALRAQPASALTVRDEAHSTAAPISRLLTATSSGSRLDWRPIDGNGAVVHYAVYTVDPASGGCVAPTSGAHECLLDGKVVRTTSQPFALLIPPGTYRIAAAANYRKRVSGSDLMLLGPPVTVR